MDSRKRRPSLFHADDVTSALLDRSSDDDSIDSEEEPCMRNDEENDILLSEFGESDSYLLSDYDDLNLMSDSVTEHSSNESDSDNLDNSDQTHGSNPTAPTWRSRGRARSRFPFNGNPGLKVNVQNTEDLISFFELFFDDELINLIVQQTNLYAQQVIAEKDGRLKKRSRIQEWQETDADEIKVYLALLLLQGIVRIPKEVLYFSKKSLYTPFFRRIMSCDRFLLLSKFLHFTNNDNRADTPNVPQKLVKLWPVLQHMKNKFSSVFVPEEHVSIDESLMLWKGKLSWK